jgi:hypothetical protein
MNSPLIIRTLLILLLFISALSSPAQGKKAVAGPFLEPRTGLTFPDKIGYLKRTQIEEFADKDLGIRIPYEAGGIRASVFIYDAGYGKVPAGTDSPVLRKGFENVKGDIESLKRMGLVSSVKHEGDEVMLLGTSKRKLLKSTFSVTRAEGDTTYIMLLTGYHDHFFKIRCTFLKEHTDEFAQNLENFYQEIGALLDANEKKQSASPAPK